MAGDVNIQYRSLHGNKPLWRNRLLSYNNGLLLRLSITASMENAVRSTVRIDRSDLGADELEQNRLTTRERGATGERRQPTRVTLQSIHIAEYRLMQPRCLAWEERSLDVQKKREEECWNRS
jgi:hypothetical protein